MKNLNVASNFVWKKNVMDLNYTVDVSGFRTKIFQLYVFYMSVHTANTVCLLCATWTFNLTLVFVTRSDISSGD